MLHRPCHREVGMKRAEEVTMARLSGSWNWRDERFYCF